jgi:hypothetical protein
MKSCFQLCIFEIIQFFNLSKTNKKLKTNTRGALGLLLSAPKVVEAGGEAPDLRLNAVDLRVHVGAVGVRACVVLLVALPVGHHAEVALFQTCTRGMSGSSSMAVAGEHPSSTHAGIRGQATNEHNK